MVTKSGYRIIQYVHARYPSKVRIDIFICLLGAPKIQNVNIYCFSVTNQKELKHGNLF